MDHIPGVTEPSGTNEPKHAKKVVVPVEVPINESEIAAEREQTKRRTRKDDKEWKKSFFNSMQLIEEQKASIGQIKDVLKCYNLALQNMLYEKQLCKLILSVKYAHGF